MRRGGGGGGGQDGGRAYEGRECDGAADFLMLHSLGGGRCAGRGGRVRWGIPSALRASYSGSGLGSLQAPCLALPPPCCLCSGSGLGSLQAPRLAPPSLPTHTLLTMKRLRPGLPPSGAPPRPVPAAQRGHSLGGSKGCRCVVGGLVCVGGGRGGSTRCTMWSRSRWHPGL